MPLSDRTSKCLFGLVKSSMFTRHGPLCLFTPYHNGDLCLVKRYTYLPMQTMSSKRSKKKQEVLQNTTRGTNSDVITENSDQSITVRILAKPGARQNSITDISSDGVSVHIAAPPVDGEANKELVKYLSKILGLRKSDIFLEKGMRSRQKSVVIRGMNIETLENVLKSHVDS